MRPRRELLCWHLARNTKNEKKSRWISSIKWSAVPAGPPAGTTYQTRTKTQMNFKHKTQRRIRRPKCACHVDHWSPATFGTWIQSYFTTCSQPERCCSCQVICSPLCVKGLPRCRLGLGSVFQVTLWNQRPTRLIVHSPAQFVIHMAAWLVIQIPDHDRIQNQEHSGFQIPYEFLNAKSVPIFDPKSVPLFDP